jgi:uncharacterized protein YndB with AHSA1/START domain
MPTDTDRIEKKILLRASRARVWRAIADYQEHGAWFGMKYDRPFTPGARVKAEVVGTTVDVTIAEKQRAYAGVTYEIRVEKVEPERLLSYRWHPHAIERGVDLSGEPETLVTYELVDAPGGVLLTVTESGFDGIPLERRAKAFEANGEGWGMVIVLVEKYLGQTG